MLHLFSVETMSLVLTTRTLSYAQSSVSCQRTDSPQAPCISACDVPELEGPSTYATPPRRLDLRRLTYYPEYIPCEISIGVRRSKPVCSCRH